MLKRTLGGEITLEQALRVVGIAQKQFGVFRSRVPDAGSFMRYLKELEVVADAAAAVGGHRCDATSAWLRLSAWTMKLRITWSRWWSI